MPDTSPLAIGEMLGDRYRVDELLSVGGMGAVYAGTHTLLQKRVAIKVLRSDLPAETSMVDRFRREAVAASAIGHENIVQVSDMGITADGTPYLVMELLEGLSLSAVIRSEGSQPVSRACAIARDILRGVAAAHEAGIIHRDLKPDNVFVSRQGRREVIKVLDFGVSLLHRADVAEIRLTSAGAVVGTPRYMAPEQIRGAQGLTGAVDIYAAGVVLYELLTAESPYQSQNYNPMVHEILAGDWIPIEQRRGDLPASLAAIVRKAMASSPADRFASAGEMATALDPFSGDLAPRESLAPRPAHGSGTSAARMAVALARTEAVIPPSSPRASGGAEAMRPSAPQVAAAWSAVPEDPRWVVENAAQPPSSAPTPRAGWPASTHDDSRPPRDRGAALVVVSLAAIAGVVATAIYLSNRQGEQVSSGGPVPADPARIASEPAAPAVAAPPAAVVTAPPVGDPAAAPATVPEPGGPAAATSPAPGQSSSSPAPPPRPGSASRPPVAAVPPPAAGRSTAAPVPAGPPGSPGSGSATSPAGPESPRPATDTAAAPGQEVSIRLRISPRSATVTVDGKRVTGKSVALERSTRAVPVRVQAAGYLTGMVLVVPDHDQEVSVRLEKAEPAEPPAKKPPSSDKESPAAPDSPSEEPTREEPAPDRTPEDGEDG